MTARPDKPQTEHTAEPWAYRPMEFDDWGIIRAPATEQGKLAGGIICQARDPETVDQMTLAVHREKGTDPWEANARRIVACVNALAGIPDPAALRASHDALVEALSYSEPYIETLHSLLLQNGGKENEAVKLCWKAIKKARTALATAKELSA